VRLSASAGWKVWVLPNASANVRVSLIVLPRTPDVVKDSASVMLVREVLRRRS
jgi:hypothetical protein